MAISKKIKIISNKIEQNKAQYDLGKETAKISILFSLNVCKYEFLTGKDVLPENVTLKKSCCDQKIWIFFVKQRLKA